MTASSRPLDLEPVRAALHGEPLLVLVSNEATLACGASALAFVSKDGAQHLDLREIRKVTHVDGVLVVAGDDSAICGAFPVDGADLKAFFADVQTVRKARGQSTVLKTTLDSRFKPRVAIPGAASEIPGLGFGIASGDEALLSPAPNAGSSTDLSPAASMPAPQASEAAPNPVSSSATPEPTPRAASAEALDPDAFFGTARPAKPNPRAALAPEREALPPRKANPRANAVVPSPEAVTEPVRDLPRPVGVEPLETKPEAVMPQATPSEPARLTPTKPTSPKTEASQEPPRAVPMQPAPIPAPRLETTAPSTTQPARVAPPAPKPTPRSTQRTTPRALPKPPQVKLPHVDARAIGQRIATGARSRLEAAGERGRFNLRRAGASLVDLALTAVLVWAVTRFFGGREFETLLDLPAQSRLDLGLLNTLKDLLPLVISGALTAVLAATAAGLVYALGTALSPLRDSVGKKLLGLQLETLTGARPSPAVVAGRFLVKAMLLLVPGVVGLMPTLFALGGSATALRSTLGFFGISVWVGVAVLAVGSLPIWGARRDQTLPDFLTDCRVRDAQPRG
jgi:hypothetical protein